MKMKDSRLHNWKWIHLSHQLLQRPCLSSKKATKSALLEDNYFTAHFFPLVLMEVHSYNIYIRWKAHIIYVSVVAKQTNLAVGNLALSLVRYWTIDREMKDHLVPFDLWFAEGNLGFGKCGNFTPLSCVFVGYYILFLSFPDWLACWFFWPFS